MVNLLEHVMMVNSKTGRSVLGVVVGALMLGGILLDTGVANAAGRVGGKMHLEDISLGIITDR